MGRIKIAGQTERIINHRFVLKVIGMLCMIQLPFLLLSVALSYYYHDGAANALWITIVAALLLGGVMLFFGQKSANITVGRKESMLTVSLSWIIISLIGMLPYFVGGYVPTLVDAFIEAVSGFTTTGVTAISDLEKIPQSILFWRSITQWQGGIGIIVFMVALIPMTGESASLVFQNEASIITPERFVPRIGVMAKWLILIYISFTLLGVTLLVAGPMDLFNAVCHACSSIATGGFSTYNSSIAEVGFYSQSVMMILMLAGATSFTLLYFAIVKREPSHLFQDKEFRAFIFLIILLASAGALWLYFGDNGMSPSESVHKAVVQVVSAITTTGFAIGDYNQWGGFFKLLMVIAMFISGCSGSTSGGLKVYRFLVLWKATGVEFKKRVHPHAVIPVRLGKEVVPNDVVSQIFIFFFAFTLLTVLAALMLSLEGYNLSESLGTSVACISNSGNVFGSLGPVGTFATLSAPNKLMLSALMILGRLEIFTFLTILQPSFWKH